LGISKVWVFSSVIAAKYQCFEVGFDVRLHSIDAVGRSLGEGEGSSEQGCAIMRQSILPTPLYVESRRLSTSHCIPYRDAFPNLLGACLIVLGFHIVHWQIRKARNQKRAIGLKLRNSAATRDQNLLRRLSVFKIVGSPLHLSAISRCGVDVGVRNCGVLYHST
jgi:hypothetical protein